MLSNDLDKAINPPFHTTFIPPSSTHYKSIGTAPDFVDPAPSPNPNPGFRRINANNHEMAKNLVRWDQGFLEISAIFFLTISISLSFKLSFFHNFVLTRRRKRVFPLSTTGSFSLNVDIAVQMDRKGQNALRFTYAHTCFRRYILVRKCIETFMSQTQSKIDLQRNGNLNQNLNMNIFLFLGELFA